MKTMTPDDVQQAKEKLRAEFPKWNIIRTDTGKWWGTRGPLTREDLSGVADVSADTPDELAEAIRKVIRDDG
ncbi:hypothetical protein [Actinomadura decatromicini]|uniref:Uncharacterized protein n=1 Tax=Actinomadura decatromicini TaxID=2604572 RepID=A0A5D3FFZ7_9ACTN|nr:hypothetical protein [Actinomadura decatromicini]TYK47143.1 hypothetical protein FXF68_25405 [Actinomadura decatromicini]